jgi:hypothetical protein
VYKKKTKTRCILCDAGINLEEHSEIDGDNTNKTREQRPQGNNGTTNSTSKTSEQSEEAKLWNRTRKQDDDEGICRGAKPGNMARKKTKDQGEKQHEYLRRENRTWT